MRCSGTSQTERREELIDNSPQNGNSAVGIICKMPDIYPKPRLEKIHCPYTIAMGMPLWKIPTLLFISKAIPKKVWLQRIFWHAITKGIERYKNKVVSYPGWSGHWIPRTWSTIQGQRAREGKETGRGGGCVATAWRRECLKWKLSRAVRSQLWVEGKVLLQVAKTRSHNQFS